MKGAGLWHSSLAYPRLTKYRLLLEVHCSSSLYAVHCMSLESVTLDELTCHQSVSINTGSPRQQHTMSSRVDQCRQTLVSSTFRQVIFRAQP